MTNSRLTDSRPDEDEGNLETTHVSSTVLTVDELAALLRVNRKTVYEAIARGEIPGARRIGGTYRILRTAVLDWFLGNQVRVSRSRKHR